MRWPAGRLRIWIAAGAAVLALGGATLALATGRSVPTSDPASDPVARIPVHTKPFVFGLNYADMLPVESDAAVGKGLDDAGDVGAGWIRVDLAWYRIEPEPGRWDWSSFDRTASYAAARGLKILAILDQPPAWVREPSCTTDLWCPPTGAAAFAAFAGKAAQRYPPGVVGAWEVWNEENLAAYWPGGADPAAYVALLQGASAAIRKVRPDAEIVLGGLAVIGSDGANLSAHDFLLAVAQAGALTAVTAIGYHPYTFPVLPAGSAAFAGIGTGPDSLVAVLGRFDAASTPIWITESGAPVPAAGDPGSSPAAIAAAEDLQAQYATEAVQAATADPDVKALFWFSDIDLPAQQLYYGLRRADGSARPSLTALKTAISAYENAK